LQNLKIKNAIILLPLLLLSVMFFKSNIISNADSTNMNNMSSENVILKATYDLKSVSSDTLKSLYQISKSDSNIKVEKDNGRLIIEDYLNDSANDANAKVVNFQSFIGSMDKMNSESDLTDGSPFVLSYRSYSGRSYKGQTYSGEHVSKGTHVHCNRFNGPHSDHKYWGKFNPKSWIDFAGSDCDWHALKYGCTSLGSMSKCDGLNKKGHGVKNCSSFKGGPSHYNWPKTAWYRN
jgi:hypothetical protein